MSRWKRFYVVLAVFLCIARRLGQGSTLVAEKLSMHARAMVYCGVVDARRRADPQLSWMALCVG